MESVNVDQLTHYHLLQMNRQLGELMKGDCIFINSPIDTPLDNELRVIIEELFENNKRKHHLVVMLQTYGGYMETVERLVAVMRKHYEEVSFVIADYAYSAGTVLALSGDNIYMDYYSVLGPIDPQYTDSDGKSSPGVGYLAKFRELSELINQSPKTTRSEQIFLVKNFDPARLFAIEQAVKHGITLITKWLPKYKFKNWKSTATNGVRVTLSDKKKRAEEIATVLGDAAKWHSHGRGISMEELTSDDIKLKIDDFSSNEALNKAVRDYHGLCNDYYYDKNGIRGFIHSKYGMRRVR